MDKMDLKKYGITGVTEIVYNPSYDELFREETKKGLRGYEKGQLTDMGAVNVMTGVYTGRSPKDKFFVMDRHNAQVPDRNGKMFYTSITSLSHISKKPGHETAHGRRGCRHRRHGAGAPAVRPVHRLIGPVTH